MWLYVPSAVVWHRVPAQRARLSYFLWRCYDEGLGKAMLVGLHGVHMGLSSERTYTFKTLPQGGARGLRNAVSRHDLTGIARVGTIVFGLLCNGSVILWGTAFCWAGKVRDTMARGGVVRHNTESDALSGLNVEEASSADTMLTHDTRKKG